MWSLSLCVLCVCVCVFGCVPRGVCGLSVFLCVCVVCVCVCLSLSSVWCVCLSDLSLCSYVWVCLLCVVCVCVCVWCLSAGSSQTSAGSLLLSAQHGAQIHHSKEHLIRSGQYDTSMPQNKRKIRRMQKLITNHNT